MSDVQFILGVPVIDHLHHLGFSLIEFVFADRIVVSVSEHRTAAVELARFDSSLHATLGSFHDLGSLKFAECTKNGKKQFIVRCRTQFTGLKMDRDVFLFELFKNDELVVCVSTDSIGIID